MVKRRRQREKRYRPEKIISENDFLTGRIPTKEDLPKELELVSDPLKRKRIEPEEKSEPKVNSLTKKRLGNGKRPRWMNCQEGEDVDGET